MMEESILEIKDLSVLFKTRKKMDSSCGSCKS